MLTQVIVLNGGSSSGKSTIARCLQAQLPTPWLSFSVDTLVDALPPGGIGFADDGDVQLGDAFDELETAWMTGIAAMVGAGANVIIDDVFLSGPTSQNRWRRALDGLETLWVGVHCDAKIAVERERAREDRITGMAAKQAEVVHQAVAYDLEVDTTHTDPDTCARAITRRVSSR